MNGSPAVVDQLIVLSDLTRVRITADDLERTMQRIGQEAYSQPGASAGDGASGAASGRESGTVEGEYREV